MIAIIGDVHQMLDEFCGVVQRLPRRVTDVIQLGDMWFWPEGYPMLERGAGFAWRRL